MTIHLINLFLLTFSIIFLIISYHRNFLKKSKGKFYEKESQTFELFFNQDIKILARMKATITLHIIISLLKASIKQQILRYKMHKSFLRLKKNIKINQDLMNSQPDILAKSSLLLNNTKILKRAYIFLKDELGYEDIEVEKQLKL